MRVEFVGECVLVVAGDDEWVLERDFTAIVYEDGKEPVTITAKAGFRTDLASVPRLPIMYWLFGGKARKGAVIHDWLYRMTTLARKWADEVFYAAMAHEESWWRRGVMWVGVRLGGGIARNVDTRPMTEPPREP